LEKNGPRLGVFHKKGGGGGGARPGFCLRGGGAGPGSEKPKVDWGSSGGGRVRRGDFDCPLVRFKRKIRFFLFRVGVLARFVVSLFLIVVGGPPSVPGRIQGPEEDWNVCRAGRGF